MTPQSTTERLKALFGREQAGTLSEAEELELKQFHDDWSNNTFNACPVCRGAFTLLQARSNPIQCPNCGTTLMACSADLTGHQHHEVDPSIPAETLLGVFALWYYPVGCTPCPCGVLDAGYFPSTYTCCPKLLAFALEMYDVDQHQYAAYDFLNGHAETLLNSLRGTYFDLFSTRAIKRFADDSRSPAIAIDVVKILNDRTAR